MTHRRQGADKHPNPQGQNGAAQTTPASPVQRPPDEETLLGFFQRSPWAAQALDLERSADPGREPVLPLDSCEAQP